MTLKTFKIPYGHTVQEVQLPEEKVIYDIHGNKAETKSDLQAETLRALREPIDSKPLAQLLKKGDKVTIIVSDLTRMVRTKEFLPVISMICDTGMPFNSANISAIFTSSFGLFRPP